MQAEDNIVVDSTVFRKRGEEAHVALFAWQWGGSTGNLGRHRVKIYVKDFVKVKQRMSATSSTVSVSPFFETMQTNSSLR